MKLDKQTAYWAAVRCDAKVFLRQAFYTLYPDKAFEGNWHIDAILHSLLEGLAGRRLRQIINLAPRHLKSFIASVVWPAYVLGVQPSTRIIGISYSDDLARTHARDFNRLIQSPWYGRVFPQTRFTRITANEVSTDQGGGRYATSVAGTLTGRGADLIIVDDPIKPDDALSDTLRNDLNVWYSTTLYSRLDDKAHSGLIVVMQRLHLNDLTGYLEDGGGYHKLAFAAVALQDEVIELGGGRQHVRRKGDLLHPARENQQVIDGVKRAMGSQMFAAQYQQAPQATEGDLLRREWLRRTTQMPNLRNGYLVLSIDTAFSEAATADYSAMTLIHACEGRFCVLNAVRGKWSYEDLKQRVLNIYNQHRDALEIVVERQGVGISLLTYLASQHIRVWHYQPKHSKSVRALLAVPTFEGGGFEVLDLPGRNSWVEPLIEELVAFPEGRYKDWVDSVVQVILMRRYHGAPSSI
jgi:predicted phage terminase large subunit-like protein